MKAALILLAVGVACVSATPFSSLAALGLRPQAPEKIVGGSQATRGEFPWIISLQVGSHICGGTIVNANTIVTAAHCSEYAASRYSVVAGEHNQNTNEGSEQEVGVRTIIQHPNYNANTFQNDIAIMKLSSPLEMNEFVQPANIPTASFDPAQNLVVAGWGTTSSGGNLATTLMKVTVPLVPRAECEDAYGSDIRDGMLCAGTGGKDSCQGDSGGPLHSGDTLVGVVSWGIGCAEPGYPGVYTDVPYFSDFISQNSL